MSPDSCIFPYIDAKFLDLRYLFFFYQSSFDSHNLPFVAKLQHNVAPPLTSTEQLSQGHLRYYLPPRLEVLKVPT